MRNWVLLKLQETKRGESFRKQKELKEVLGQLLYFTEYSDQETIITERSLALQNEEWRA